MKVPPKIVPKHVRTLQPADDEPAANAPVTSPAVHGQAAPVAAQRRAQSLPVLEAFQEFLEEERRRTRTRILILSAVFLLVLLTVAGLSFLVGYTYYHQIAMDFQEVRKDVEQWKSESGGNREYTQNALSKFAEEAVNLRNDVTRGQASLDLIRSNVEVRVASQTERLSGIGSAVDTLRTENEALRRELAEIKSGIPTLAEQLRTVLRDLAEIRSVTPDRPPEPPPPPAVESLTLQLQPPGAPRPVAWRLPIAE